MSHSSRKAIVRLLLWIAVPAVVLGILRPWTIRPLEGQKPAIFDAGTFASSVWPRLVREATQTAADLSVPTVASGPSPVKARFVKGTGMVASVDRQSRVGVIRLRLSGSGPGPGLATLQIGPVIRGTALRDAASFIQFSDFTNQIDYAGAANALNDYALRTVMAPLTADILEGTSITFIGAAAGRVPLEQGAIEIVPVSVAVIEGPRR